MLLPQALRASPLGEGALTGILWNGITGDLIRHGASRRATFPRGEGFRTRQPLTIFYARSSHAKSLGAMATAQAPRGSPVHRST